MKSNAQIVFGDLQTPPALAKEVCQFLLRTGEAPDVVLEPTCGRGVFMMAAAEAFPRAALCGWDVNSDHVREAVAQLRLAGVLGRSSIVCQDFFEHDWESEVQQLPGKLLILGNFPWVTNSAVAAMNGSNLPAKGNFLGLRGVAARTGKSNFDISEWMLICLVRALRGREVTIAMLLQNRHRAKAFALRLAKRWSHQQGVTLSH